MFSSPSPPSLASALSRLHRSLARLRPSLASAPHAVDTTFIASAPHAADRSGAATESLPCSTATASRPQLSAASTTLDKIYVDYIELVLLPCGN